MNKNHIHYIEKIRKSHFFTSIPFITAFKMMAAGVVCFTSFILIPPKYLFWYVYGYWSVVTVAAITQAGLTDTFTKGLMRLLGTIVGAAVGYFFAIIAQGHVIIVLILFFIFITLTSYIATQPTLFSYGGVIAGVTMIIVLASSLMVGNRIFGIAVFRSLEVIKGIIVLFVINFLLSILIDEPSQTVKQIGQHLKALPHELSHFKKDKIYWYAAIKIAMACLATFGIWIYFRQLEGIWATITCLLIMEENKNAIRMKSWLRFLAHVVAALFGGISALLIGHHLDWRVAPLAIGFLWCGYMIGKKNKYSSLGNTTGIAMAIMLLASPGYESSFEIIGARFLNVMFGIFVSIFVTYFLWPQNKGRA